MALYCLLWISKFEYIHVMNYLQVARLHIIVVNANDCKVVIYLIWNI